MTEPLINNGPQTELVALFCVIIIRLRLRKSHLPTLTLSVGRVQYWTILHKRLNEGKPRGRIFSDQNCYCLCIHFYVFYFFELLPKHLPELRKTLFLKCRFADFRVVSYMYNLKSAIKPDYFCNILLQTVLACLSNIYLLLFYIII